MTDKQRILVLREAIYMMAKLFREHPIDMDWYLEEPARLLMLMDGTTRDPQGREWASYFVFKAHEKLKGASEIEDVNL